MSLSLFTVELERWALYFLLLISPISTDGFEFHELQVRDLAKFLLFGGLHSAFGHLEVLHERFGVSWSQVAPFEGKGGTWSHMWGIFERPGHSFFPNRCDLASVGCFLMRAMADI